MKWSKIALDAATAAARNICHLILGRPGRFLMALGFVTFQATTIGWAAKPVTPAAPSGLTAAALSASQIGLTWVDNANNETGFKIERAPTAGGRWAQIATVGANATAYADAGLNAATAYYYRVRAYANKNNSSYSAIASATTFPAALPCTYGVSPTGASVAASGGSGSIGVTAGENCNWTAASTAAWITIISGHTGQGNGTVGYTVAANASTIARSATLTIAGQSFTVTQSGAPATPSLAEALDNAALVWTTGGHASWVGQTEVAFAGGSAAMNGKIGNGQSSWIETTVSGPASLAFHWKSSSEPGWDGMTFAINGVAQATVTGEVDWQQRVFSIPSGTHTLRWTFAKDPVCCSGGADSAWLDQVQVLAAAPCTFALSATTATLSSAGGSASVTVTAEGGCEWTVSNSSSWVTITSGLQRSGPGIVGFTVAANDTCSPRSAVLTIAGQAFTINQTAGTGNFALSATSASYPASGGSDSVTVLASAGDCSWTASSSVNWVAINSGVSARGDSAVNYSVLANTSANARIGTMTIAGQSFTVTQAGVTCTYAITPTTGSHTASGGSGTVSVTAPSGCSWSAASGASWISVTSGGSGAGNGSVSYTVAANTTANSRTGNITIAGQSFTVTQAGVTCTYAITPTTGSHTASGGSGTVSVTAPSGCSWSAASGASWISVTSGGSGTGNGSVSYTVAANTTANSRTGNITIAGQSFTVTQAGVTCTYAITPTTGSHTASGGSGTVSVTAPSGCSWSAASGASWISVTSGGSGTGNGSVSYTVAANTTANSRTGNITIAGQSFTVTQAGVSCSVAIAPASASAGSAGASGSIGVTAASGCVWTATSAVNWITVTAGSSGSGNGTVSYSVAANASTSSRTGTTTIDGQTFTVTQAANARPVANAGPNQAAGVGTPIIFNGSASYDPDGSIASYAWVFGDLTSASGVTVSHVYAAAGTYGVTLTVTDNLGATASASATVVVTNPTPLTVTLTSPANGSTVSNTITLAALASVNTARVEFYCNDSVLLGAVASAPHNYSCDTTKMANGSHRFHARAYDALGNAVNSQGVSVTINNPSPVPESQTWARGFGGTGNDSGIALTHDDAGNVLLAANFTGTASFGGADLASAGGRDILLALYTPGGTHLWSRRYGGPGEEYLKGMARRPDGGFYVCGGFVGTANFGGNNFVSAGEQDMFVAAYDAQGNPLWSKAFAGDWNGASYNDVFYALAVDAAGNVWLAAGASGKVDFGGGYVNPWSQGGTQFFLVKFSPTGQHLWSAHYGNGNSTIPYGLALDAAGNVFVAGSFRNSVDFGGGPLSSTMGLEDIFLVKYAPSGAGLAHVWSKRYGLNRPERATALAIDANGDAVIVGNFYQQTDLGFGTVTGTAADIDLFAAKYSGATGAPVWQRPILGTLGGWPNGVVCDAQNGIHLTGYFYGANDFGGQTLTSAANGYDVCVASYRPDGTLLAAQRFGGGGVDIGSALVARDGRLTVTGLFNGTAQFGNATITSKGGNDCFVMKMEP